MGNDLVLVVDDDLDLQDMLEFILQQGGCRVLRACSGKAALELLREVRPSLILLDLMLPDLRGEEILQEMRALLGPSPPVVVVSASVDVAQRALNLGVASLSKPFGVEDLMELVQRHCPSAIPL